MKKAYENSYERFMKISLICIVVIALIASITFICIKRSEGIPESESANLLAQEHLVTQDFSKLSSVEGVELRTAEEKVIVTFYEKTTKLEAIYNKDYNLISSAIIRNRLYDSEDGVVLVIIMGGIILPLVVWLVAMCAIALIHDGIVALKKIKHKGDKQDGKA